MFKNGLIEILTIREEEFINQDQLQKIEKYVRFYYELDINIEGIDTIMNLLRRIDLMRNEIIQLKNRLGIYEKSKSQNSKAKSTFKTLNNS